MEWYKSPAWTEAHGQRYTKNANGLTYGGHPDVTQEGWDELTQILDDNRNAFAWNMSDITGYTGKL